jgi:hypothetical protein
MDMGMMIGALGTLCAVFFGFMAFRRNQKHDDTDGGQKVGIVLTEIGFMKAILVEIQSEQKDQRETNARYLERLITAESSAKQAERLAKETLRRLDELKGVKQ